MWIRQLEVADCAGVKAARVSFEPGLNVLHGPNELGKSTLVQALRAALLLPASSSAADALRTWNVDSAPSVKLTFEQQAQRIWRIRKRFGRSGAQTYLDLSRDGREFSQEDRGRGVENAVQKILRWGIEPPGGKSGRRVRGMPQSFITSALLGDQRNIEAILNASLATDPHASGRDHLTDALQAMAEDPRFKQVLAKVQEHFDEAFTATGRRRSGRGSPWSELRGDRASAEQREQAARQQVESSEAARARVADLQQRALEAEAERAQAVAALQAAHTAERQLRERAAATQALADAQTALQQAEAQVRARDDKLAAVAAAEKEGQALRETLAAAEQALAAAQPLTKAAAERVRQAESENAEQARRLREQEARNRHLKLAQRKSELQASLAQSQQIAAQEAAIGALRADIEKRAEALEAQRRLLAQEVAKTTQSQDEIAALERERDCARYVAAKQRATQLTSERDAARTLAEQAEALEDQAQALRGQAKALGAPAMADLDELNRLRTESRVASAKLDVGLAIEFTPQHAGAAQATIDGATRPRKFDAGEPLRFEAQRELRLTIDGVGTLQVRGGGRDARAEAEAATDRWRRYADSLFDRAGVATTAELEEKRGQAGELLAAAEQRDRDAAEARVRSEDIEDLERLAAVAQAEAEQREQAALKRLDAGVAIDDHLREHGEPGDVEHLDQAIDARKDALRGRESRREQLASEAERDGVQLDRLRADLTREESAFRESVAANEQWRAVLAQGEEETARLERELAQVAVEIEAIGAEAAATSEQARQALAKLQEEERAKTKARDEAEQRQQAATTALARLQGEAETLRAAVEPLNVHGLRSACDDKQAVLDALTAPDDAPEDLTELDRLASDAANRAIALGNELSSAQGALSQVGGQRIEEQAAQAKEALAALARREHELEVEYGGWKLLRETLEEAEREDAIHLGEGLVGPVSERMAALTGGRYSGIGIGPQLDATGIRLGGEERKIVDVSVGTREQIALLLRLAIAEALGSFIVLDDHLTQSDPARMAWIRNLLGEAARKIQVVVMTCHPQAYLTGNEHAVDLTRCIERHDVGGAAANAAS